MAWEPQRWPDFRNGARVSAPLGKVSPQEAEAKAAQVNYLLLRLKQRLLELPPSVDIADFLQHGGKPPESAPATPRGNTLLVTLRDRFLAIHAGAHEKNTLYTARIHFNHLIATLGEKFPLPELAQADLQRHVDRRAGEAIALVTIKKEINSFRAAWNWGRRTGLVSVWRKPHPSAMCSRTDSPRSGASRESNRGVPFRSEKRA